jgi:(E)-4-hydroxy-3-methyl-but-2-enyl pyrophosphate reductase
VKVILAESAGFCFGVNNAVNMLYNLLGKTGRKTYTLGPIIHNEQVVAELEEKGVNVINSVDEAEKGSTVVIRTHGVTPGQYEKLKEKGVEVIDATCPYVKKIHGLVHKKFEEGFDIIIAGDEKHPEVIGVNGWCGNTARIVAEPEDVSRLDNLTDKVCIVAQTTFNKEKWEKINEKLSEKCKNVIRFDTICNATSQRQEETKRLAEISDMMIVVGSKSRLRKIK